MFCYVVQAGFTLNLLPKASKGWDCRLTATPIFQSRFYFELMCLFLARPSAPLSSLYPFSSPTVFNYPRLCNCGVTYLSSLVKHPGSLGLSFCWLFWIFMCSCVCMLICLSACGGQRSTSGILQGTAIWDRISYWVLVTRLGWLASEAQRSVSLTMGKHL